jgi:hypothetical protein
MGVRHRLAARAEVPLKSSRSRAAAAGCGLEQARHKQELKGPPDSAATVTVRL